jgi:hypothetical protein
MKNIYGEAKEDLKRATRSCLIMVVLKELMVVMNVMDSIRCFEIGNFGFGIAHSILAIAWIWLIVYELKLLDQKIKNKIDLLRIANLEE